MAKYYTCRAPLSPVEMCLKPTVTDSLCIDHAHEAALDDDFKFRWPLWPL